ncbi:putative synapse-associated protein 1 [Apostichopus japonicus]|uniref:Putative synapse-associated protein 1 n=1 Tax=Stichopus japonicus TaxID=307972 RepID=A0A2G8KWB7_STIJA|nr:putative synapse-associated protein 1 [Apostichopus japonicus]
MEVLSSWWGGSKSAVDENVPESTEESVGKETKGDAGTDEIKEDDQQSEKDSPNLNADKAVNAAKDIGNYLYNFAKVGSQRVSETATKTASVIQKTVEERVTLVGDFQKEQEKFIQEKHSKRSEAAVPPWVGYNEEKQMKEQILALSQDKRNFLRNPPAGVQFHFDFTTSFPVAMATLQEDPNLQKMRFSLVPSKISEEHFWKNYFYRVSLIKQSSQLTSLAASSGSESKSEQNSRSGSDSESSKQDQEDKKIEEANQAEEDIGGELPGESQGDGEFISDDYQSVLDKDDVLKGMEQLGMDSKDANEGN